jgi:hypothetical protein
MGWTHVVAINPDPPPIANGMAWSFIVVSTDFDIAGAPSDGEVAFPGFDIAETSSDKNKIPA